MGGHCWHNGKTYWLPSRGKHDMELEEEEYNEEIGTQSCDCAYRNNKTIIKANLPSSINVIGQ